MRHPQWLTLSQVDHRGRPAHRIMAEAFGGCYSTMTWLISEEINYNNEYGRLCLRHRIYLLFFQAVLQKHNLYTFYEFYKMNSRLASFALNEEIRITPKKNNPMQRIQHFIDGSFPLKSCSID